MSDAARLAFEELAALGAAPVEGEAGETYAFCFGWQNYDGTQTFADIHGQAVREEIKDGRLLNPDNFRQDVHEILAKHDLVTDWYNFGTVLVYDDPDAPGLRHSATARDFEKWQRERESK